jgi:hypothetical protein
MPETWVVPSVPRLCEGARSGALIPVGSARALCFLGRPRLHQTGPSPRMGRYGLDVMVCSPRLGRALATSFPVTSIPTSESIRASKLIIATVIANVMGLRM